MMYCPKGHIYYVYVVKFLYAPKFNLRNTDTVIHTVLWLVPVAPAQLNFSSTLATLTRFSYTTAGASERSRSMTTVVDSREI